MISSRTHSGYIFLISILVIGAIGSATAISLLLLGWAAEQNGLLVLESSQAYEYAQTCVDRSLRSLRADPQYGGSETITFEYGSCIIQTIGGSGSFNRTLCIEGHSGDTVRRVELSVDKLYSVPRIRTWQEVPVFTLC